MSMTASTEPFTNGPPYVFDNDDRGAADRHRYLTAMLDETTVARLAALGDLTGRRCLELGAGGGSIARWLADQVGPSGQVIVTDLNPRHIPAHPGYTIVRHDLRSDRLPASRLDLIVARAVLMHVDGREEILPRLAGALAPGGVLLVEDFHTAVSDLVLAAPSPDARALYDRFQSTLVEQILPAHGTDPTWAPRIHAAMLAAGLTDVDTHIFARSWPGGTAGALISGVNIDQVSTELLARGFIPAELDSLRRLVADPRLVLRSNLTYSTLGRRPVAT
jgi:SAM-dependent methyltransferase